jgi:hypothetical protein
MAATAHFDTLDYARKLEAAGVPKVQAELQAQALNDAFSDRVASREDLARLEAKMDAGFAAVDAKMDARFGAVDGKTDALNAKIDARCAALDVKIDTRIDALRLELGGKIATLTWMVGVMVALIGTVFVQSLFRH